MYWRNIISERRPTFDFIGAPGLGRSVGQGRGSEYAPARGRCEVAPDSSMLGSFAILPGNGHHDEATAVQSPAAGRRPAPGGAARARSPDAGLARAPCRAGLEKHRAVPRP